MLKESVKNQNPTILGEGGAGIHTLSYLHELKMLGQCHGTFIKAPQLLKLTVQTRRSSLQLRHKDKDLHFSLIVWPQMNHWRPFIWAAYETAFNLLEKHELELEFYFLHSCLIDYSARRLLVFFPWTPRLTTWPIDESKERQEKCISKIGTSHR